jgi:hypothetical protein
MAGPSTHGATPNRAEETDADGPRHEQAQTNKHADENGNNEDKKVAGTKEKNPSVFAKALKKLDLDLGTVLMMMK